MRSKIGEALALAQIFEWRVASFKETAPYLIDCRAKARIPNNAKSIIIAAFPYKVKNTPPKNISRYAAVPDYHDVCGKMLKTAVCFLKTQFKNNNFEFFLDNSPIPEVAVANFCGLGKLGKNGLLIHEKYGSYIFLGEIITDLELIPDLPLGKCLDCGQCERVCPTLHKKEECLSAVNQQKKPLSSEQTERIRKSGSCFGCDICSEVCPMNKNAQNTYIKEFIEGYRDCFTPEEDREGRPYNWRGKEVIDRNYYIIAN